MQNSTSKVRVLTGTAMLGAVAAVLMYLEFPIPIMPAFVKLDVSELPALIASFAYGPVSGILVCLIKNLIKLPSTSTAAVGELFNFVMGALFVGVAGLIYKRNKTRKGAIVGALLGALVMAGVSVPYNYFIVYPAYVVMYHLPLDAITILAGVAGMGKTWLALKWAADISTGRATKDGTPGLVYYFTQENDPHVVLSPRLESLGADPENIVIMQQMADTPALTMCDARLDALASRPGCRPSLVVFDPIQSYLEKHANMNQAADVRPMMDHLANFAARYHCAVMLVSHISKPNLSGGSASDRILGSSDFRNAARSIIFVGCDPDDRSLRVFAQDKSSLGLPGPSRKFSIHDGGVELMDECALTADEILRGSVPNKQHGPEPKVGNRAVALIGELIKNKGWVKASEAYAAADKEGISPTVMSSAANSMELIRRKCNNGIKGGYTVWYEEGRKPDFLE